MLVVMRLGPGSVEPIRPERANAAQRPERAERAGNVSGVDAVAASAEIQAATEAVRAAAEVRADRVAAIRAKIQSGKFRVDPAAIAEAIIDGV